MEGDEEEKREEKEKDAEEGCPGFEKAASPVAAIALRMEIYP